MMSRWVTGIQLNRTSKFFLCSWPIPVVMPINESERRVRLGESIVDRKSLQGGGTRFRHGVRASNSSTRVGAEQSVGVSQPRVSLRILRLNGNGLLEEIDCLQMALLRAFVPKIPSLQIQLVSFGIHGAMNSQTRLCLRRELNGDLLSDGLGDFAFEWQDFAHVALVFLRPHMDLIIRAHKLGRDSCAISFTAETTLQNVLGAEFAPNLGDGLVRPVVLHRGGASDDAKAFRADTAELRNHFFSEPFA